MQSLIKAPKDFWCGVMYFALGAAALWFGAEYPMGTAVRMGPGYFPKVLAGMLVLLGAASLVRSFITPGEPVTALALKPLVLVLAGCTLFGVLLPTMGFIVALFVLCLVSAAASDRFGFEPKVLLGLLALVVCCTLVFVKGLGVPLPLLGSWLEPVLGPILPWLR